MNSGVQCNIEAMWSSMHHLLSAGYDYRKAKQGHENRGVAIISLGPVPRKGSINPHSYNGLSLDTKKIEQFRTMHTFGTYPWKVRVQHSLATLPQTVFGPTPGGGSSGGSPEPEGGRSSG